MAKKSKIIVVMPAYNAEETLKKTINDLPKDLISEIILVDDGSSDKTVSLAQKLGLTVFQHPNNLGYGGNQKTCYWEALKRKPDIVVMIHPDYQYDSSLTVELIRPIIQGRYDYMFGSRIRTRKEAIVGGMPSAKYFFNRFFTLIANLVTGNNFSEYMSGMRAYSVKALRKVPFQRFSNNFIFDQQFAFSALANNLKIGEIPIPIRYYLDSSSISWLPGLKFGFSSLYWLFRYWLHSHKILKSKILQ
jgi:glycosyltransferase involved in cell wall biosynthesis